jgi:pSer/pThr/pTyr-binding forkhead associated (FHA) protein
VEVPLPAAATHPRWVEEVRRSLPGAGCYLTFRDDDAGTHVVPIEKGWTRIGRSANADVLLDDPSVSRRHAMIVAEPGKHPRVFDDRSLNGILVNGQAVDWGALRDGDELAVGRFRLYLLVA